MAARVKLDTARRYGLWVVSSVVRMVYCPLHGQMRNRYANQKGRGASLTAHLANVLEKLVDGWPAARIDELLPWAQTYAKPAIAAEAKIAA